MSKKIKRSILLIATLVEVKITSSKIPSSFKGYKILQISDLHNKKFGDNQD
ncbi:phosphoesterase, partial [Bacillus cereus]